jgi:hypothetical protein
VGAEWSGDPDPASPPDAVIWDDPYGNTLNDWHGSGNDVRASYRRFVEWIKPTGNTQVKWAHLFKEGGV